MTPTNGGFLRDQCFLMFSEVRQFSDLRGYLGRRGWVKKCGKLIEICEVSDVAFVMRRFLLLDSSKVFRFLWNLCWCRWIPILIFYAKQREATRSNAQFGAEQMRSHLFREAEDLFALVSGIPSQKSRSHELDSTLPIAFFNKKW